VADFCKQCSIDNFGEDSCDLADHTTKADTDAGVFALVLCEGCGLTRVDHTGACVSSDCIKHHGVSNG